MIFVNRNYRKGQKKEPLSRLSNRSAGTLHGSLALARSCPLSAMDEFLFTSFFIQISLKMKIFYTFLSKNLVSEQKCITFAAGFEPRRSCSPFAPDVKERC